MSNSNQVQNLNLDGKPYSGLMDEETLDKCLSAIYAEHDLDNFERDLRKYKIRRRYQQRKLRKFLASHRWSRKELKAMKAAQPRNFRAATDRKRAPYRGPKLRGFPVSQVWPNRFSGHRNYDDCTDACRGGL